MSLQLHSTNHSRLQSNQLQAAYIFPHPLLHTTFAQTDQLTKYNLNLTLR